MPRTMLSRHQIRDRFEALAALLREPCTPRDRGNARILVANTLAAMPATDTVGTPFVTPSLDALREADGADMLREVL